VSAPTTHSSGLVATVRRALELPLDRLRIARDPVGWARSRGVTVGKDAILSGLTRGTFGSEPELITIGDHVGIGAGVGFVTHDGCVRVFEDEYPDIQVFGTITIGNNVVVGVNAVLLPGTSIGDDSVVGAGAVARGTFPPGSVIAGVPARVIGTRETYRQNMLAEATFFPIREHRELVPLWRRWVAGEIDAYGDPLPRSSDEPS
jgi:Hexapeptide repeat of succinyl-transferase